MYLILPREFSAINTWPLFWRSVDLTGNQTDRYEVLVEGQFWRSVDLTGNQTARNAAVWARVFWRSVDLTGNQTASYLV